MVKVDSPSSIRALLDITTESMQALANIGRPTKHWDDWIVYANTEPPTWAQLQDFLNTRFRTLFRSHYQQGKINDTLQ